jgi:hypothetical protein
MAKRPEPKKSSLAGSSSIAPPAATAPTEAPPAATTRAEPRQPAAAKATAAEPSGTDGKKAYPHKVSFYQDKSDTDRLRGALLATQHQEGYRSMSAFIAAAVMAEVERLETTYNGGQPFPQVSAKGGQLGRPMGE